MSSRTLGPRCTAAFNKATGSASAGQAQKLEELDSCGAGLRAGAGCPQAFPPKLKVARTTATACTAPGENVSRLCNERPMAGKISFSVSILYIFSISSKEVCTDRFARLRLAHCEQFKPE